MRNNLGNLGDIIGCLGLSRLTKVSKSENVTTALNSLVPRLHMGAQGPLWTGSKVTNTLAYVMFSDFKTFNKWLSPKHP